DEAMARERRRRRRTARAGDRDPVPPRRRDRLAHGRAGVGARGCGLSLGADWGVGVPPPGRRPALRIPPPRRALLLLEGAARAHWQHRIPPVKEPRVSLSFRTVRS